MLRITSQSNASAAKAYFDAQKHDYYLEGQELPGVWSGKGAELLGLKGEVTKEQWDALCENRDPNTGQRLTPKDQHNRRVLYDFTWSAPKSYTLAMELGHDDRLMGVFQQAVAETMKDVEADVITRYRVGGEMVSEKSGNALIATYVHRTARPVGGVPDCQLHAHATVLNATFAEGKWRSVEVGEIKAQGWYYEAVFMARLAKGATDLGYGIRRKGRFWELEHVSNDLVDKFSRRTKLIEEVAEAWGKIKAQFKAELGGKTRERKAPHISVEQLQSLWEGRLDEHDRQQLANLLTSPNTPLPTNDQAMQYAVAHAFERSAVVGERKLVEEALRYGVGGVDLDGVREAMDGAGVLVKGDKCTTEVELGRERNMIRFARDGKGTVAAVVDLVEPSVAMDHLNDGQRAAVNHVLGSRDRITMVRGAAGTGKSTSLKVAADAFRQAGLSVQAVAISNTAKDQLLDVDDGAATVARFLVDKRMQQAVQGGVVILDEASLVGNRQMQELLGVMKKIGARGVFVGDARQHSAVEAGSPFRAMQKWASLPVAEITDVVRQSGLYKSVSERLSEGRSGQAIDLLDQMGWVTEADYTERMRLLAAEYVEAVKSKQSVVVVAPTHAEGQSVNQAIREALKKEGTITDEEHEFKRLVPLNLTEAEQGKPEVYEPGLVAQFVRASGHHKAGERAVVDGANLSDLAGRSGKHRLYREEAIRLGAGDSIRITGSAKDASGNHKLTNGAIYTVTGFGKDGRIKLSNGWEIARDVGHFAYAYSSTSHASQGRTVDRVLVDMPVSSFAAASMESFYVSATRGRSQVYVYTDDAQALREVAAKERVKANAQDLFPPESVTVTPSVPVNPVRDRATFMSRVRQVATKIKQQVRSLTHTRKELDYGYER
ncbi:MobF family relaxase [Limnoglobus roseus]|uniref:Conjugative relaxase n=1 Tax=Limnoglobus roseus TaxID=2598579 RepID=A0A5C1AK96_9BACT|nr:MobF family relaxase [Limnoglobus roseus]QEL19310.1 conjugative relaxase [Limnoglobus roseus]